MNNSNPRMDHQKNQSSHFIRPSFITLWIWRCLMGSGHSIQISSPIDRLKNRLELLAAESNKVEFAGDITKQLRIENSWSQKKVRHFFFFVFHSLFLTPLLAPFFLVQIEGWEEKNFSSNCRNNTVELISTIWFAPVREYRWITQ